MPTYQYLCRDCGHDFEAVHSMRDDALTMCPVCGGQLRKVFAPPVIAFKGSGFYATDHGRSKRRKEPTKADKEGAKAKTDATSGSAGSAKEPTKSDKESSSRSEAASS